MTRTAQNSRRFFTVAVLLAVVCFAAAAQKKLEPGQRVDLNTARARQSYQRGFYVAHGFKEVDSALLRFELQKQRP